MFGLTNQEGNHGEDVKDYWWYLDALPSSAWLRWRYHYPQAAFPYEDLVEDQRARGPSSSREYELLDTGVFDDDRYWIVEVHYAKADPTDILMRVTVRNRGPEDSDPPRPADPVVPQRVGLEPGHRQAAMLRAAADGRSILASHPDLGDYTLEVGAGPDGTLPTLLFCENETNLARIEGVPPTTPYPKDGINDHVVAWRADTVNPERRPGRRPRPGTGLTVPGRRARPRLPGCGLAPDRARTGLVDAATAEAARRRPNAERPSTRSAQPFEST